MSDPFDEEPEEDDDDDAKLAESITLLEEKLKNKEDFYFDSDQYEDLISHYLGKSKLKVAELLFKNFKQHYPQSDLLMVTEGILLFRRNKYKKAIKIFDYAEKFHSNDAQLFFFRFVCYTFIGKKESGYNDFYKAFKLMDGVGKEF